VFNAVNPKNINCLAMASTHLRVTVSSPGFKRDNFVCLGDFLNSCEYFSCRNLGTANRSVVFGAYHKYLINTNLSSHFMVDLLYHYTVVLHHLMLAVAHAEYGEDLLRMRWDCNTDFRVVHVEYGSLISDFNCSLAYFLSCSPTLLSSEWYFPSLIDFRVFRHLIEFPLHFLVALFVKLLEECTKHRSLCSHKKV